MNEPPIVSNFGDNVSFQPTILAIPESEMEVLQLMRAHRGRRMRAVGRLHSWSDVIVAPELLFDLKKLNAVTIHEGTSPTVEVGAGCQIKQLLSSLNSRGYTTPALGLITEQTIAGATATGTHGSGRPSLSHFVQSVRIAGFDPRTGDPTIRTIHSGDELLAARCSLGLLGIILSVRIPIRSQYLVEEHFCRYSELAELLSAETEFPLQQSFFVPWRWDYFAQHRREVARPRSRTASLYRAYWSVGMDRMFHWMVMAMGRFLPSMATTFFYRWIMPALVPQGWKVVDRSDRQLTMEHELYRHIETEIFVERSKLSAALAHVKWLLRHSRGEAVSCDPECQKRLEEAGEWQKCVAARGQYVHHYPICIRKVLPDETFLSMSSGSESVYALSFVSYAGPNHRDGFFAFSDAVTSSMAVLFDARPHWGKFHRLSPKVVSRLYAHFEEFQAVRKQLDPEECFGNSWLDEIFSVRGQPRMIPQGEAQNATSPL